MPGTIRVEMVGKATKVTLKDSNPFVFVAAGLPLPATVWARPNTGDTITVEESTDDGATFRPWPTGPCTAYTEQTLLSGVTHLRFTRSAGSSQLSSCGVC